MHVVRASHKKPILPHEDTFDGNNLLSRGQEVRVDVPDADKVALILNRGEISLHYGLTIHGSGPYVSDDRRIGVILRYLTPCIKKTGGERDYAHLARGADVHGNWVPSPIPQSAFDAKSLAVYEDIRNLQTAVTMKGAKKASNFYEKAE